jgi:hypothetical protein
MALKQNYFEIILEDINSKLDRLVEVVVGMQQQLAQKADKTDIERLDARLGVIEYSIKQSNKTLQTHERRITRLEKAQPSTK